MGLDYRNLDDRIRQPMLAEIDRDIAASTLYLSDNLSDRGRDTYPELIREAARPAADAERWAAVRDRRA